MPERTIHRSAPRRSATANPKSVAKVRASMRAFIEELSRGKNVDDAARAASERTGTRVEPSGHDD